jgi:hypothetical protein
VAENHLTPQTLLLKSTIPVTCPDAASASQPAPCSISLNIKMTSTYLNMTDIAVRQRYPGIDPMLNKCSYVISESDWKPSEQLAYNVNGQLELVAQVCYRVRTKSCEPTMY